VASQYLSFHFLGFRILITRICGKDVGNKAAVFPLQLLGFDVDVINSVHFSNHTGYSNGFEGDVLDGEQLKTILYGLKNNGLIDNVTYLLTGYIGKENFLRTVVDFLKKRSATGSKKIRYVCDPVLGDDGKFYVSSELVSIYRDEVIPLADIITPNKFEAEQLSGISIANMEDGKRACRALHDIGPELVVITSLTFEDKVERGDGKMTILASVRAKSEDGCVDDSLWFVHTPIIPGSFTGVGDLFAALLLGWTSKDPNNLPLVLQRVVSTLYSIIKVTKEYSKNVNDLKPELPELRLIQSKNIIDNPPLLFEVERL